MMDWKKRLSDVDEDYLVGISNRGIVKRAYKDLEAEGDGAGQVFPWDAAELVVTVGGETVAVRDPLGESRCTCPSRSVCRHVIMAILLARQAAKGCEGVTGSEDGGSSGVGPESGGSLAVGPEDGESTGVGPESGGSSGVGPEDGSLAGRTWQEILARPRKPLLRALGGRGLRRMAAAMEAGTVPEIKRGTVVRVVLPGQDISVKLLSPLECSTCTCHKKELCSHKAEAILWCQYLERQFTAKDLSGEQERTFDMEMLLNAADQVRGCLERLLETGLARSGGEQVGELERLAIVCHNEGLPGWEGELRALAEGYGKYLNRWAGQTMEKLAGQLQRLYDKTLELKALANQGLGVSGDREADRGEVPEGLRDILGRIRDLTGEFRSEYLPAGNLELTGVTVEHFVSDSGYEGDTVYFLESSRGIWYTFTSARPTFYEGKKRGGYLEKAAAPWGIPLPLEGLAGARLLLRGAKCDRGGRLSSSQDTKGELLGKSELTADKLGSWYYRDFGRLLQERIEVPGKGSRRREGEGRYEGHPRLVFVQAARFEQGRFYEITQRLELPVWDREGRRVLVELPYSKGEESSIRYLERLKQNRSPCFLGRVYLRDSQICLYPVDLLEGLGTEEGGAEEGKAGACEEGKRLEGEGSIGNSQAAQAWESGGDACRVLGDFLEEVCWLLQEVYQSGSAAVQDGTLEALGRAERQSMGYGMDTLSVWLKELGEGLGQARHSLKGCSSRITEDFCRLWRYVELCRSRAAYDLAREIYKNGDSQSAEAEE